jgi:hypothetical protein
MLLRLFHRSLWTVFSEDQNFHALNRSQRKPIDAIARQHVLDMSRSPNWKIYDQQHWAAPENTVANFSAIRSQDSRFDPSKPAGDAGGLFRWNGRLCRSITNAQAPFLDHLLRDGIVNAMVKRGLLIESELYYKPLTGYAAVLTHRSIPFISYPNEWCARMLRDGALTIIDLAIELSRSGLTLENANPRNVLFDSSKPVYVDLTSIGPQEKGLAWSAYDQFCRFCYYPLILMSAGQERIARALIRDDEGVLRNELRSMAGGSGLSRFFRFEILRRGFNSIKSSLLKQSGKSALSLLKEARRDLEKIQLPSYKRRDRSRRIQALLPLHEDGEWTSRQLAVRKLLTKLNPANVLDVSRGPLWTATVPAMMGFNVVSADMDAARISALYRDSCDKNLSILPLLIDFMKPSPSVGYSDHYSIAATERLKCDLVLALGLTSEAIIEDQHNFDVMAAALASFSKRWLVIEYDDPRSSRRASPINSLASASGKLRELIDSLAKHFGEINLISSRGYAGALVLCEK